MSAGAWIIYDIAKKHLCDGTIDLDSGSFRMSLYTSASNCSFLNLSTIGSCIGEVSEGFGYSSSGKPLASVSWGQGASAAQMKFTANPVVWTAGGGSISGVKYAVIWQSGAEGKLLCYCQLSTQDFSVTSGNTLTVSPTIANGFFALN